MASYSIGALVGKAVREGRYLAITYKNQENIITPFWIRILDILPNDRLKVDMFNVTKEEPLLNKKIYFSRIQSAEVLRFSHYEPGPYLLKKLESDPSLEPYGLHVNHNRILTYYLECYRANCDPFLYQQYLIPGIDLHTLQATNPYVLDSAQQKKLIAEIYQNDYPRYQDYELALCEFSIDLESRGKFVVAYRKLSFDPVSRTLVVGNKVRFNPSFYIQGVKHALSYYSEMTQVDFENWYLANKGEVIQHLQAQFRRGELANTRPELVVLGYRQFDISRIYNQIEEELNAGTLQIPLKALFQNMSSLDTRNRTKPNIVLYDDQVNRDQLRTIYNALKYPVTYVQGPPGTGKTQTILNIVVNCFTSNKTLLISSNNNVPIDGILAKLKLGTYKNKPILFPILRLGNKAYTLEALETIRKYAAFESKDIPRENLLSQLKEKSKVRNRILDERLESIESRLELEQNLEFVEGLIAKGSYYLLEKERSKLLEELEAMPPVSEESLKGIFEVIEGNHSLLQFFYFESLKCIKRLRGKEFQPLMDILKIEFEDEQIKAFNSWLGVDANLELLLKVFPVILTTNISAHRLGHTYKFDLLVIDEAGQCDIPTSLVPISKCRNMVLIGDTNQLKPIILLDEFRNEELMQKLDIQEEYNYRENSILSVFKRIDNISRNILLSYHYRCGKKIINYSNQRFYENKLNIDAIQKLGTLKLIKVSNHNQKGKNSQLEEAVEIVRYIQESKLTDVFILTPFRNQEEVLNHYLKEAKALGRVDDSVQCGTIHKVQGQENKTIVVSTALATNSSKRTYNWIKNNSELINVGVTRAKENLIVVCDPKAIATLSNRDDDLYALIEYVAKNGEVKVAQSTSTKFTIGFSNDSRFENEFYKTMQHYCTIKQVRFERNVKLVSLFPEELNNPALNKKEFDGVLYEGKQPKVVFELNGIEHYKDKKRMNSDRVKSEYLNAKGIQLLMIPNPYVKHYEFIRELIGRFHALEQTRLF
ncbi:MAG: DNA2/NAM7 family helicase [Bacteroidetes bacterium]|nr:DNA2/NAM7 family helicase [Bacteroidota bacterium]